MPETTPPETIEVDAHAETVGCDGGGALGHPMVYYSFGTSDAVDCGYCGRRFVKRHAAEETPARPEASAAAGVDAPAAPDSAEAESTEQPDPATDADAAD